MVSQSIGKYYKVTMNSQGCTPPDLTFEQTLPDCGVLDTVVESIERKFPIQEVRSSIPYPVKPMTYKLDIYHYLAWRSAVLG